MSSRSLTWRRVGVGAVAVATAAAGLPLLLGSAAHADAPTRLTITQDDGRSTAAAGTCTAFTISATDAVGGAADAATITVNIAESPSSATNDVDFCTVAGGTAFLNQPQYLNASTQGTVGGVPVPGSGEDGVPQTYTAGPSLTGGPAPSSGGNPDGPSNAEPVTFTSTSPSAAQTNNTNNPSGRDNASFATVNGVVRFGLAGLQPGTQATIDAFVDPNADRTRENGTTTGTNPTADDDNVVAPQRRISFTDGGVAGSVEQSNAARTVVLTPERTIAAKADANGPARHTYSVQAFNQQGDVLGGLARLRAVATAGPNAPTASTAGTFTGACGTTGNQGQAGTCTYDAQRAGTDTVTVFVNQSTGNATFELDPTEPRDTSEAVTTPPSVVAAEARRLELTPETASLTAGTGVDFVATVTDVNGAPAREVSVTFLENGPGGFTGGTAGTGAQSTRVVLTDGVGRAVVRFTTAAGEVGSNAVFASITTPASTRCQETASGATPAGQCADSSPVTVTAAAASPSPSATPSASTSPSPSASPSATPTATTSPSPSATTPATQSGSRYRGLSSPVRVLDTRDAPAQRREGAIVLDLSQRITDPNATTAVLNVTVTNANRRGFLVAYPTGTTKPGTSNVNFEANQTQANEVVVRLSSDRRVTLFVDSAAAHVIADLVGSFTTSTGAGVGAVTTATPERAFDSRNTGQPTRTGEVVVNLSDVLPAGATDAILNVTVTRTSARGFVTVFPTGTARPGTSNVNFERGQTQANEVITRVGTGANAGRVSFTIDSASAALIVDVVGAVSPEGRQVFTALSSPQRAFDSRESRGDRRSGNVDVTMPSTVPAGATGVILNVTATNGSRAGFVTVFPFGEDNPGTSNVNFPTNRTQANEVVSGLGGDRQVTLFVGGGGAPEAHVIVDVVGYFTE